jgi:hypothetical protein
MMKKGINVVLKDDIDDTITGDLQPGTLYEITKVNGSKITLLDIADGCTPTDDDDSAFPMDMFEIPTFEKHSYLGQYAINIEEENYMYDKDGNNLLDEDGDHKYSKIFTIGLITRDDGTSNPFLMKGGSWCEEKDLRLATSSEISWHLQDPDENDQCYKMTSNTEQLFPIF